MIYIYQRRVKVKATQTLALITDSNKQNTEVSLYLYNIKLELRALIEIQKEPAQIIIQ